MCAVIVTPRFFVKLKFLHDVSVACGAHVMCTQYHYRISFSYVDVCIICVWLYIYNLLPTISTYYINMPWYVWCVYGGPNLKVMYHRRWNTIKYIFYMSYYMCTSHTYVMSCSTHTCTCMYMYMYVWPHVHKHNFYF